MLDPGGIDAIAAGAAAAAALTVTGLVAASAPVPARLRDRVRPYTRWVAAPPGAGRATRFRKSTLLSVESLRSLPTRLGRVIDGSSDSGLVRKLHRARVLGGMTEDRRVAVYRTRVAVTAVGAGAAAMAAAGVLSRPGPVALGFAALGFVAGAAFWRGRLDRAIEQRRTRMRIELYTINQLLAMQIRVGRGVIAAVRRITERGNGEVVHELRDVLRLHRGGMPAAEALRRVALNSPEPQARRTYRALATADERGSDVAVALLAMSEDIRDGRREAMRRRATRRRALMLLPILGLLAPILILFVAAPLPWLVLRGFG